MRRPYTEFIELVQVETRHGVQRFIRCLNIDEISPAAARKMAKELAVAADWAEA